MGLSEVLKRETAAHHRVPEDEDERPGEEGALGSRNPPIICAAQYRAELLAEASTSASMSSSASE
jgi:hypothetical protein